MEHSAAVFSLLYAAIKVTTQWLRHSAWDEVKSERGKIHMFVFVCMCKRR